MCDWKIDACRFDRDSWKMVHELLDENLKGVDIYSVLKCCKKYDIRGDYRWFDVYYYKTDDEQKNNKPHTKFVISLKKNIKMEITKYDGTQSVVELLDNKEKRYKNV